MFLFLLIFDIHTIAEALLLDIGLTKEEIKSFLDGQKMNLKVLFDSNIHEQTASKCHQCIDGKGPTITFVKSGGV